MIVWVRLVFQFLVVILPAFMSKKKQVEADDVHESYAKEKELEDKIKDSPPSTVADIHKRMRKGK